MRKLNDRVTKKEKNLYLWCAGVVHTDIPPELKEEILTTPLRSAPSVIREVQPRLGVWSDVVHDYSDSGLPAPGDGPSVIKLRHDGDGHENRHPVDCVQCGRKVATKLGELGVGAGGECIR